MKLTYRGTNYDYDIPAVNTIDGDVAGTYRGQKWNYRYPRHIPVPQQAYDLKYRGVSYNTSQTPQRQPAIETVVAEVESGPACPIRPMTPVGCDVTRLNVRQPAAVPDTVTRVHLTNICNILERRLQAAKARGDEKLLRLLEREAEQLAC